MSAKILYHGANYVHKGQPFDHFDLGRVGDKFAERIPALFVTESVEEARRWAFARSTDMIAWNEHHENVYVLAATFDTEQFNIANGRTPPAKILDIDKLSNWIEDNVLASDNPLLREMFKPDKAETAKDMARATLERHKHFALIDQDSMACIPSFIGDLHESFLHERFNSFYAWSDVVDFLKAMDIDAIDPQIDSSTTDMGSAKTEVYIFEHGLTKMPAWTLHSVLKSDAMFGEYRHRLGEVIISAGNVPKLQKSLPNVAIALEL